MSNCSGGIRFVFESLTNYATLTCNKTPLTPLDYLKSEWRSRITRFISDGSDIVITGQLDKVYAISGFALTRHNLSGSSAVKFELLLNDDVVYSSEKEAANILIPMGQFRWGIDVWGGETDKNKPFSRFFNSALCNSFRLTISALNTISIDIDQLIIGDAITLDYNFDYGNTLKNNNGIAYKRTHGGSAIAVGSRAKWRELVLPFNNLTERDRRILFAEEQKLNGRSLFVSPFPLADELSLTADYSMTAKLNISEFNHAYHKNWTHQIALIED